MMLTQLDIWADAAGEGPGDALPVLLKALVEVDTTPTEKRTVPALSLDDMGRAWYITAGGCARPISDTGHIEEFTAMVNLSIRRLKPKIRASLILARVGLDYSELLDRWYILDELAAVKATFPLFRTQEEAKKELL